MLKIICFCVLAIISANGEPYRYPQGDESGRRGSKVNLGDIDDQTLFSVDKPRKDQPDQVVKGGDSKRDGLDCKQIMKVCNCNSQSPSQPPSPNPTTYQLDYYDDVTEETTNPHHRLRV